MTRDELFVAMAVKAKMITEAQVEDARKLQNLLSQNGFKLTLPEILTRKEYVNPDQNRLLTIALRFEEIREDDLALGAFLSKRGFLSEEKVRDCLNAQDAPYREGRPFPRLRDLVVQKGYLTEQQLQVILRARMQFDPSARPPSGPLPPVTLPAAEPAPPATPAPAEAGRAKSDPLLAARAETPSSLPARAGSSPLIAARPEASPPLPARSETSLRLPVMLGPREVEAGLAVDHLRVTYRKSPLKENPGGSETFVTVLDVEGALDARTFKKFDHYLTAAIDNKGPMVILNCEKLDYVSSAGIGVLAGATKRCRDQQGDLRLCGVSEKVKKIINLVGLQSMLRMYEGERGAILSFRFM